MFSPDRRNLDGLQGRCKKCLKAAVVRYQAANKGTVAATKRKSREKNSEKIKAYAAAYRSRTKEAAAERNRRWVKANPAKNREKTREYEARKRMATPPWADQKKIDGIYEAAEKMRKETGTNYEVDHIVPLNSRIVQGLHVAENLQIIPGAENASKKNRHWPDMP